MGAPGHTEQVLSELQGIERARAFCRIVSRGLHEVLEPRQHNLEVLEKTLIDVNVLRLQFVNAVATVDLRTGNVVGYADLRGLRSDEEAWSPLKCLSSEQLIGIARRTYAQAGFREPLEPFMVSGETAAEPRRFNLFMLRTRDGIPFTHQYGIEMTLDYATGRLVSYGCMQLHTPNHPASLTPSIDPFEASHRMIAKIFACYPMVSELVESNSVRLGVFLAYTPAELFPIRDLTEDQVQRAQANIGELVYWASYRSPEYRSAHFTVYVDAKTGRVMAIETSFGGNSGLGGRARKSPAFGWAIGPGPIELMADGRRSIRLWGSIERASAARPYDDVWTKGAPIVLRVGKLAVRCRFGKERGTLATIVGGKMSFGLPDRNVKAALIRLTNSR